MQQFEAGPHYWTAAIGGLMSAKLLTRRELADVIGVHANSVTNWERDGMPVAVQGSRGISTRFDESAVRAWLDARDAASKQQQNASLESARIRRELSQARLNEQKLLVAQRKLLPAEEVEKAWGAEVAAVRAVILASYTTHADRVFRAGTIDGIAGVERALKLIAHEVLRELASGQSGEVSAA